MVVPKAHDRQHAIAITPAIPTLTPIITPSSGPLLPPPVAQSTPRVFATQHGQSSQSGTLSDGKLASHRSLSQKHSLQPAMDRAPHPE